MRSPFTGVVFAVELTHDMNMMLPLVVAVTIAHAFTVLTLKRSILTEKISRRGNHLGREYAVDPLEFLFVKDAMSLDVVRLPLDASVADAQAVAHGRETRRQRLYPVVDTSGRLTGVVTRSDLEDATTGMALPIPGEEEQAPAGAALPRLADVMKTSPVLCYADETLRLVAYRMAESGLTRLPVVDRESPRTVVGLISLRDLLKARTRTLEYEKRRERVLRVDAVLPVRRRATVAAATSATTAAP
jgi:CBS domain-containing protein